VGRPPSLVGATFTTFDTETSAATPSYFLPWHGHHRALPSFPTRRSSDLDSYIRTVVETPARTLYLNPVVRYDGATLPWPSATIEDRKSTRLNSSHVAISYAVFCLKKKMATPCTPAPCGRASAPGTRRTPI